MVSLGSTARIIIKAAPTAARETSSVLDKNDFNDSFFTFEDLISPESGAGRQTQKRITNDIDELMRNCHWEDIVSLYHPVETKVPDLVAAKLDLPVREKIAFAMGQLKQFDPAIEELLVCVKSEPDNFYVRSSLAYTAYNSLYAAKNREVFLAGEARKKRIMLAHENFEKARELRPDTVTNNYRQGMLLSQIENKPDKAQPLFQQACDNWEGLTDEDQSRRHQEKKNYIKSLYRLASLLLQNGDAANAFKRVNLCLSLDEKTNYVDLTFKYFALGKVQFHLGNYDDARNALMFANQSSTRGPRDFVAELLARSYLAMGRSDKALGAIATIPEAIRKPYVRWTEADAYCNAKDFNRAERVLKSCLERDRLSKHKTLMRLTKIAYLKKEFEAAMTHAGQAAAFFQEKWGNPYYEGLLWQAVSALRLGKVEMAEGFALELKANCRNYPKLDQVLSMIEDEKNR